MDNNNDSNDNNNDNDNDNALDKNHKNENTDNISDIGNGENHEDIENIEEILNIKATREMMDSQYFTPEENKKRLAEEIFEWIEIFSSALITVILLFTFIFRLVTVEGPSMRETLHPKDNLIISHLFYTPKQNDIVVIQVPDSSFTTPIIKRVIATEGQTVRFDFDNWKVYVDGELIDEPYVNYESGTMMNHGDISIDNPEIVVEPGKIFVMGDNRNHSSDSRSNLIKQVDVKYVVGRVLIRIFPLNQFGVVKPNAEY